MRSDSRARSRVVRLDEARFRMKGLLEVEIVVAMRLETAMVRVLVRWRN